MGSNILPLVLQTIATVVTVLTLYWRISKSYNDRQAALIAKIKEDTELRLDKLEEEMKSWEDRRRADVRALHKRADEQEDFVKTSIISTMSRMEGEMKGMSNILRIIEEHFIRTGVGER